MQDDATAELMSDFYRRLAAAGSDTDPLAIFTAARKALRAKHADPFYWAPFLMYCGPRR